MTCFKRLADVGTAVGFFFVLLYAIIHWVNYRAMLGLNEPIRVVYIYLAICFVLLLVKTLGSIRNLLGMKWNCLILMSSFLLAWLILIHVAWYFEFRAIEASQFFLNWSGATLIAPILFWLVGEVIGIGYPAFWKTRFAKSIIWISFVLGIGIVGYGLYLHWFLRGGLGFIVWNPTTARLYDYQSLADYVALLGLFIMSIFKQAEKRLVAYLFLLGVLFFAYSRSAFFIFALAGFLFIAMSTRGRDQYRITWVTLFIVMTGFLPFLKFMGSNLDIGGLFGQTFVERMIMFSHEPSSPQRRLELLDLGLEALRSHWLLGEYASEWWRDGGKGGYVHNWLSFWISYGIGPFLLFGIISVASLHKSLAYYKRTGDALPISLIVFTMSSIILSRSYIWPFVWLVLGYIAGLRKVVELRRIARSPVNPIPHLSAPGNICRNCRNME